MPTKRNRKIKNKKKLKNKKTMKYKMKGGDGEHIFYVNDTIHYLIAQTIKLITTINNDEIFSAKTNINQVERTKYFSKQTLSDNPYRISKIENCNYYFVVDKATRENPVNIPVEEFNKYENPQAYAQNVINTYTFKNNIPQYNITNEKEYIIMLVVEDLYKFTEILPNSKTGLGNNAPNKYLVVNP